MEEKRKCHRLSIFNMLFNSIEMFKFFQKQFAIMITPLRLFIFICDFLKPFVSDRFLHPRRRLSPKILQLSRRRHDCQKQQHFLYKMSNEVAAIVIGWLRKQPFEIIDPLCRRGAPAGWPTSTTQTLLREGLFKVKNN